MRNVEFESRNSDSLFEQFPLIVCLFTKFERCFLMTQISWFASSWVSWLYTFFSYSCLLHSSMTSVLSAQAGPTFLSVSLMTTLTFYWDVTFSKLFFPGWTYFVIFSFPLCFGIERWACLEYRNRICWRCNIPPRNFMNFSSKKIYLEQTFLEFFPQRKTFCCWFFIENLQNWKTLFSILKILFRNEFHPER